jgi:hypothetical protein
MNQGRNTAVFFSLITVMACFSVTAQPNPTLPQIDSMWRAFNGAPAHQCLVVFNKMTGGSVADESKDSLCIMRLISGEKTATIKNLMSFSQCAIPGIPSSRWGQTSGYAISRDGSRIAAQNCDGVIVCDTNGAHMQFISTTNLGSGDNAALCFDDTTSNGATIHRVVYAARNWLILRTTLSDLNAAIKNDTLWKLKDTDSCFSRLPLAGGYTSVNKFGHFLAFQLSFGIDIPMVVDLRSKQQIVPTSCSQDGCQVRLCKDSLGTVSYHEWSHYVPTTLWRWGTPSMKNIGTIPCLVDPVGCDKEKGDPGQGGENWCETDTNYMIQVGDNDVMSSPGCISKAYIRKGKTNNPPQSIYLGDYFGWPNMWIDPEAFPASGAINGLAPLLSPSSRVTLQITGNGITVISNGAGAFQNARLITAQGTVIAKGEIVSPDKQRFPVNHLATGIYFLTWQAHNTAMARIVVITR